jgi:hypothetical protein
MSNSAEVIQIRGAKSRVVRMDEWSVLRTLERLQAELSGSSFQPLKVVLSQEVAEGPARLGLVTRTSDPAGIAVIQVALSRLEFARQGEKRDDLPLCFFSSESESLPTPRWITIGSYKVFYSLHETRHELEITLVALTRVKSDGFSRRIAGLRPIVIPQAVTPKGTWDKIIAVAACASIAILCAGVMLAVLQWRFNEQARKTVEILSISERTATRLDDVLARAITLRKFANELKREPLEPSESYFRSTYATSANFVFDGSIKRKDPGGYEFASIFSNPSPVGPVGRSGMLARLDADSLAVFDLADEAELDRRNISGRHSVRSQSDVFSRVYVPAAESVDKFSFFSSTALEGTSRFWLREWKVKDLRSLPPLRTDIEARLGFGLYDFDRRVLAHK